MKTAWASCDWPRAKSTAVALDPMVVTDGAAPGDSAQLRFSSTTDRGGGRPFSELFSFHPPLPVDVAMRWNADMFTDSMLGFANGVHTPQGGTHQDGLKAALTRVLNSMARQSGKLKEKAPNLAGDFLRGDAAASVAASAISAAFRWTLLQDKAPASGAALRRSRVELPMEGLLETAGLALPFRSI